MCVVSKIDDFAKESFPLFHTHTKLLQFDGCIMALCFVHKLHEHQISSRYCCETGI